MLLILGFPIPILIAIFFGLRGGRSDPQTMMDFGKSLGFVFAWALTMIFLYHAFWIATVVPSGWVDNVRSATSWTLGTGAVWLPALVITYVLRAMKARTQG
ncbi:MAG: hypothetical protein ACPG5U_09605 [Planktomarina sp.]